MTSQPPRAAVIGGGPAGLTAAEILGAAGVAVDLYDAMPTLGRKFLMAGRGGLNLTHSEPAAAFLGRYGSAGTVLAPMLAVFGPDELRAWTAGLGIETFVGSSGRIFPVGLKASPLLRAWLARLGGLGVRFHPRHRWTGFAGSTGLRFESGEGAIMIEPDVTLFALGGASWPRLGSTGAWAAPFGQAGVELAPFEPANAGFRVAWSPPFREKWAGTPLKTMVLTAEGRTVPGEAMITATGIEGGAIYALGADLRRAVGARGEARLRIDLKPGLDLATLHARLALPRRGASLATHLKRTLGLPPVAIALLREAGADTGPGLAEAIKGLELRLTGMVGLERAISTAGGVSFAALDPALMLRARPGCFVAGEMVDWEAPTGGYLLQACFATGRWAAQGALAWLKRVA